MSKLKELISERPVILTIGMATLLIAASLPILIEYIAFDIKLLLALIVAPLVFRMREPGNASWRYSILALLGAGLFWMIHMRVFFLLMAGACLLFILESRLGRFGELPILLILLLSPVIVYLLTAFTFPIRLEMSAISGKILNAVGFAVEVQGNFFKTGDFSFSVDPACMGLNMIATAQMVTILLIAFGEKKTGKKLPFAATLGFLLLTLALTVMTNLIRIIALVIFRSMPDTIGHDIIGLVCLLAYVVGPVYVLLRIAYKRWGKRVPNRSIKRGGIIASRGASLLAFALIILTAFFGFQKDKYRNDPKDESLETLHIAGMEKEILENGISKFESPDLLMYIKPPARFWGADHTPAICWAASGYEFKKISTEALNGHTIFTAELIKDEHTLYTAWWYDNGPVKTHSQWDWRKRMIKGEAPFRLLNFTTTDKDSLRQVCGEFLNKKLFTDQ